MKRDLDRLEGDHFDLLIIGGGIFGAAAAWEATTRGLAVALLEKGDFGAATTANSYKIAHGGMRYLQHVREAYDDFRTFRREFDEENRLLSFREWLDLFLESLRSSERGLAR